MVACFGEAAVNCSYDWLSFVRRDCRYQLTSLTEAACRELAYVAQLGEVVGCTRVVEARQRRLL